MLKVTDIEKLAKECNLEVNVDLEYDIDTPSIYYTYSLLLELKDLFELIDYYNLFNNNRKDRWEYPYPVDGDRTNQILEELHKQHIIDGY